MSALKVGRVSMDWAGWDAWAEMGKAFGTNDHTVLARPQQACFNYY